MWQAQAKNSGRGRRRKGRLSVDFHLGHAVKSCMTVIESMGRYQVGLELKLTLCGQLFMCAGRVSKDCFHSACCV